MRLTTKAIQTEPFSLAETLESGQLFRWQKDGDGYAIQQRDKTFYVEQQRPDVLAYEGIDTKFLRSFFTLGTSYERIRQKLSLGELAFVINAHPGIRLIKQDPWECTVNFICSSCSNIPRITRNIQALVDEHGRFPTPKQLSGLRKNACGLGFRAAYLRELGKQVDNSYFARLARLPYEEAKASLMQLPGIGEKVADCICLFSLGHTQAFPVDTHIEKAMFDLYGLKKNDVRAFAAKKWGSLAGYAQQYLFHWRRLQ